MGADLTYNGGVCNFFASFRGNVFVAVDKERARAFGALAMAIWPNSYTLAQAAKFIGSRGVPNFGECGMFHELAVVEIFSCGLVKHWACHMFEYMCNEGAGVLSP